jgi:cellulose synthase (UDP-forming)
VIFLCFGVSPVQAWSFTFFLHLLPYLAATQVLFLLVGWHKSTWRGQQYSLALFPIWIQAMWTATLNVVLRRPLGFLVTPKDRSGAVERDWRLIKWQLLAICLLVVGIVFGIVRALLPGHQDELVAIGVNIGWAIYDLVVLSVVLEAFFYNPVRRGGAVNPMRL